jgi:hypothetical protein
MTSIKKMKAGIKEETEQVEEAEISETERIRRGFQRIEKPLLKFPFHLQYITSTTANVRGATLWSTIEEFLSEYYTLQYYYPKIESLSIKLPQDSWRLIKTNFQKCLFDNIASLWLWITNQEKFSGQSARTKADLQCT